MKDGDARRGDILALLTQHTARIHIGKVWTNYDRIPLHHTCSRWLPRLFHNSSRATARQNMENLTLGTDQLAVVRIRSCSAQLAIE